MKKVTEINQVSLHYKRPHIDEMPKLKYPSDIVSYLLTIVDKNLIDLKEYCWVGLMTSEYRLLGISEVSSGTIDSHIMNIREILQVALLANATRIVVIHNHPSGNLKPSQADIDTVKILADLGRKMDIHLIEDIIITSESMTLMSDKIKF